VAVHAAAATNGGVGSAIANIKWEKISQDVCHKHKSTIKIEHFHLPLST
ncbi:unnamed protein product, partial [Rotaria sordida]